MTNEVAPKPLAVEGILACLGALLIGAVLVGVDAARRVRRQPVKRIRWWRSAKLVGLVGLVIEFGLAQQVPIGWRAFAQPSVSMAPTLLVGDYYFVDRRSGRRAPALGDLVTFHLAGRGQVFYTKRVVGLPGDVVAFRSGVLVLNGRPVPTAPGETVTVRDQRRMIFTGRTLTEEITPGARYQIMHLDGALEAVDTPSTQVPAGELFVLGDNRDDSLDSRYPSFGLVRIADVIGTAGTIYWAMRKARIFTRLH